MASLARWNAALSIAERDQMRGDFSTRGIGPGLRGHPIVLRIREYWQLRVVSGDIRCVARRERRGDRLHRARSPFVGAKIFQLFPDYKAVHPGQIWSGRDGAEAFRSVTVITAPGQQHSSKGISAGRSGNRV